MYVKAAYIYANDTRNFITAHAFTLQDEKNTKQKLHYIAGFDALHNAQVNWSNMRSDVILSSTLINIHQPVQHVQNLFSRL
jgi:hypothetical protein